jgi:kumamolisin
VSHVLVRSSGRQRRRRRISAGIVAAVATLSACTASPAAHTDDGATFPLGASNTSYLLSASTDLGPSKAADVQALVSLPTTARPASLYHWAAAHRLRVTWHLRDAWAMVHGPASAMAGGFAVPIHDYRARSGTEFYSAEHAARVPAGLRQAITGVGTISSYIPKPRSVFPGIYQDVPKGGLTPTELLNVYDATPLTQAGFTGKGQTIVFFEIDGFRPSDLSTYARQAGLPPLKPVVDTSQPGGKADGQETVLDLEVAHAIVPQARLVVFNMLDYLKVNSFAQLAANIGKAYSTVDRKYPQAIWSLSIILGCNRNYQPADMAPMQQALATAISHGSTAYVASGDAGGFECKGGADYGDPPAATDIGVNGLAEIPAMTSVGGTALSTDAQGHWIDEQTWTQSATQQGTGGGVATNVVRPSWQQATGISAIQNNSNRLIPDVAADADPFTGVKIFMQGKAATGGGTSQAAPIWAAITVQINQYLAEHGGHRIGDINPLLYKIAASTPSAFHDITLGGSAVYGAQRGYDLATGLGSPNVSILAGALLKAQGGAS